jgi:hypothetical protein
VNLFADLLDPATDESDATGLSLLTFAPLSTAL